MASNLENIIEITDSGIVIPDTSALRDAIIADLEETVFLQEIDHSQETVLGRLVEWMALCFAQITGLTAWSSTQVNMKYSTGAYLDAWASNFGISRKTATNSRVSCICQGTAGTVIPAGSLVRNSGGDLFSNQSQITLNASGEAVETFYAVEPGPIPCAANTVNVIATAIPGWDTVNNASDGTVGTSIETDDELRARIRIANFSGSGYVQTIAKRILQLDGVVSAKVVDNPSGSSATINGVSVPAHSIFVCVSGGDEYEIARTIFNTKPLGTGYYTTGLTAVTVTDEMGNSGDVYFARPSTATTQVSITVKNVSYGGSDVAADVKSAIEAFLSTVGIGGSFTTTSLAVYVQSVVSGIVVTALTATKVSWTNLQIPALAPASTVTVQ